MKKRFLLAVIATAFCFVWMHAQKATSNPCDSVRANYDEVKAMYDVAVYYLDSIIGDNNKLLKEVDSIKLRITRHRTEINELLKKNEDVKSNLTESKKLIAEQGDVIADQMAMIKELEAEVKRLSKKSSK